ncbi:uncharacterized protein LOC122462016 [Chelonia mydas]|uniref:uncharacterized protein LOC122462016 n=1 Tax=Chelonia mydas TaxID=8469 RepID=UPI001CA923EA|nr:uncharacterized protein LOC122462016 [Chelonia mydas]
MYSTLALCACTTYIQDWALGQHGPRAHPCTLSTLSLFSPQGVKGWGRANHLSVPFPIHNPALKGLYSSREEGGSWHTYGQHSSKNNSYCKNLNGHSPPREDLQLYSGPHRAFLGIAVMTPVMLANQVLAQACDLNPEMSWLSGCDGSRLNYSLIKGRGRYSSWSRSDGRCVPYQRSNEESYPLRRVWEQEPPLSEEEAGTESWW